MDSINRRDFLKVAGLGAASLTIPACNSTTGRLVSKAPADRPNIVFILADDLGFKDVGYHGGDIKTPNIDKLASEGTRLDQFYVQPVCSPTRSSLMTSIRRSSRSSSAGLSSMPQRLLSPIFHQTVCQKILRYPKTGGIRIDSAAGKAQEAGPSELVEAGK